MRVAVTGCTSDFGTVILPRLFEDPDVEEVVGIDLREPRVSHAKLRFEREDVRSPRIAELVDGCDVVVHLAFIVAEIHDKVATHDININGSRNVIEAAHAGGARRLVLASSVASYGMHEDNPVPLTEDAFPRGNHDKYYFYDKAEVEHFVLWWKQRNPDAQMTITLMRPVVICGPHFRNGLLEQGSKGTLVVPKGTGGFQWLHEDDLADAFHRVVKEDHPGPFNVAPDDGSVPMRELAALHGQRIVELPRRAAAPLAELFFRLRLSPASADWVGSGEVEVANDRLKRETGWRPRFSGREAASIHLIGRGRPITRPLPLLHRREVAEAALATPTAALLEWSESVPGLREGIGGRPGLESALEAAEHEFLPFRDGELHAEVHAADGEADATVVFSPGIGGHARFYTPALAALKAAGLNAVGLDRPGHGLSTGRRGDAPMPVALDAIETCVRWARERFGRPVALAGSSLGGITSWYALTREPDVACAVCHNISHPSMRIDRRAELSVPLILRAARALPLAPVRIKDFADFGAVALDPAILDWFERETDPLWNWTLTMRTGASFFDFEPQLAWERVTTPVLAMIGTEDAMVSADYTRQAFERATPPSAELRLMPGMGHMLFLENLSEATEATAAFVRRHAVAGQRAVAS
jgi:nucleoside-diphosphate-sugar epimerase/alpha-beta hydrolase superfamily lysophospholipase